jgi:hypothetical protein
MKHGRWLPALAALAALLTLVGLTGARAAAAGPSHSIDRVAKIAPLVVQSGKRNYAGPRCPGRGWTCTTATRVLQSGDDNRFECTPQASVVTSSSSGGSQSCEIVQSNPNGRNTARCVESSHSATTAQVCKITQTGASNTAVIEQTATSGGPTQSAAQTAAVTQTGATRTNSLTLRQHVNQTPGGGKDDDEDDAAAASAPTSGTIQQDAWQRADVVQTAAGAGTNSAVLRQDARQHAVGGATQLQNTSASPLGDCYAPPPASPNACVNVSQTAAGGTNEVDLNQKIDQKAKTKAVATQQQGSPDGGVEGRVHQETAADGRSFNQVNQNKVQRLSGAPGSAQTQYDPMRCCGVGSQAGGHDNQESIAQGAAQQASEDGALQSADLSGESLTPNGTCDVTQQATNNADEATNRATLSPCPFLLLETRCTNSSDGDETFGSCTASEPVTTPPGCEFECGGPLLSALRPRD